MSGGSYGYLYAKEAEALFADTSELESMATRLAGLGWAADAATDALDLVAIIRTQKVRVDAAMRRLSDLFQAVEWWDSNDWSEDQVRAELAAYRGEDPDRLARLEDALRHIADGNDCTNYRPPSSCRTNPGRSRDANEGAVRWCDTCIALDALNPRGAS